MPGLDFPNTPSNGDLFGQYIYDGTKGVWRLNPEAPSIQLDNIGGVTISSPVDGQALVFDGVSGEWINAEGGGGGSINISATAPLDPANGDLWWDSDNGRMYIYYDDGTSAQWVTASGGQAVISDTAPVGYNGQIWWNSNEGKMYVFYDDGTSSAWVAAGGPQVTVQATPPAGYQGQMWLDSTDGSMYVYYTDPGGANSSWIGAVSRSGGILQVVSTTKTDVFSSSQAAYGLIPVPGLTVSITPRSTSSKILVQAVLNGSRSSNYGAIAGVLTKDGSTISGAVGDAATGKTSITGGDTGGVNQDLNTSAQMVVTYLDSPSTTSTVEYGVSLYNSSTATQNLYLNRTANDASGQPYGTRTMSTITVMEIAG